MTLVTCGRVPPSAAGPDSTPLGTPPSRKTTWNANAQRRNALEAFAVTRTSPKILVVDDDPNITRAIWRRFRSIGIEVIQSHHGKEGMVLALTEHPDIIITDYKMPGISGERLLMNLKYNDVTKDIPVIMVTGVTISGGEDYALKRQVLGRGGAVMFMNKPLDFEALLMELRRHIRIPQQGDTPGTATGDDAPSRGNEGNV